MVSLGNIGLLTVQKTKEIKLIHLMFQLCLEELVKQKFGFIPYIMRQWR